MPVKTLTNTSRQVIFSCSKAVPPDSWMEKIEFVASSPKPLLILLRVLKETFFSKHEITFLGHQRRGKRSVFDLSRSRS